MTPDQPPPNPSSPPSDQPLPAPIATTPRLTLRPFHLSDAPALAIIANNPRVAYNLTSTYPSPYTLDNAHYWCRTANAASPPLNYAIIETSTSALIGSVGFTRAAHPDKRRALTLGYWLGEAWWGQGLMAEAVSAVVGWAFETWDAGDDRLERVEGCAYARNGASAKVLEKVGFLFEGRKRAAETKGGEVLDLMMYGVTRGDWEARRGQGGGR
ncbi:acyl-CoA N-acyltransferase [Schizothecium vesticola]|uniref:Acyl-CoA N-acyltransferase n=1 Tax=Schizothecium vesticola TaxID=314040 RepID=A0AA40EUS0_9PEZI|nr:acyl-CoA N-acyltransferase [Schizothecium vesticola]